MDHGRGVFGTERCSPGAHGVKHPAEAKQIGAMIDRVALGLFRGHVLRSACHNVRVRNAHVVDGPSQTEIGDLYSLDAVLQQDIGRFDITVNQSLGMCGSQPGGGLRTDTENLLQLQWSVTADTLLERLAGDEFHDQIGDTVFVIHAMDRDHVIVADGRGCLTLAAESFASVCVGSKFGSEDLDGDDPLQLRVVSFQHDPHAAVSDQPANFIASQPADEFCVVTGTEEVK